MSLLVVLVVILVQVLGVRDLMTLDQRLGVLDLMTLDQRLEVLDLMTSDQRLGVLVLMTSDQAPEDRHLWICFMRVIRTWHQRELSSLVMVFLRQVVIHFS